MNEPVAYINIEERSLEWATHMQWETPTVVKMDKIPLYTAPLLQPKPVAIKFQIYKPTPPRGGELKSINSPLLPWVYDQDPSSGNTASMWVTPVATLPPQPELEPVAWFSKRPDNTLAIKIVGKPTDGDWEPLYTALPQRKEWVGLTDDEVKDFELFHAVVDAECVRAIEAKLREKNT